MAEDQQRALGGKHVDRHPSHARYLHAPDAGGIDGDGGVGLHAFTGYSVAQVYSFDPSVAYDEA